MSRDGSVIPDYLECGQGKPLVLLPGTEGAKEFWRFQWDDFGRAYRVVACSLPRLPLRPAHTTTDYAEAVLRLWDRLSVDRAAVIGESFGGMVALDLAIHHPDRVSALVLCNSVARFRWDNFGLNPFTLATAVHPFVFVLPGAARKPVLRWVGRNRGFVMDPSPGNDNLADYLLEHALAHGLGCNLDRWFAASRSHPDRRLSEVRMPTLVVRGTEDRVVPDSAIRELLDGIPGAELALIHGGGHCCPHTVPEATNRAILEWLIRVGY